MYRTTVNSGYAQVGEPGSAGMGQVISGALEMSNVDLAQEFTNLVVAQRGFQANSRIITTSDEILQELVSMKR
jgi:flagellar hook protein FlgE